jgi:hypothetical protein
MDLIQKKTCISCNEEKSITEFHKNKNGKYGVHSKCKKCKNKADVKRVVQDLPRLALRQRTYMANNPHARIAANLRKRMRKVLNGISKCEKTFDLLGCTPEYWKDYLEQRFKEGMSWDNYGEWHIDHIVPCSAFDLTKDEDQKKCFHYTNTQPLWAEENMKKGPKINYGYN